jgi:PAS domain S-box-containing protein
MNSRDQPQLRSVDDLRAGDHLCCIYSTEDEHRALLTLCLRQGVERGEKIVYIAQPHEAEALLAYLRADGLPVEPYLASGQLALLTSHETCLFDGTFDPDRMINLLRGETDRALADGYKALRVTGEMTRVLRGVSGSKRLIEYEAKLNRFLPESKALAICQYDRRRFPARLLLDVLRSHPIAAIGTNFYENFYYVHPDALLGPDPIGAELDHCCRLLEQHRQMETALPEREASFRGLDDVTKRMKAQEAAAAREAALVRANKELEVSRLAALNIMEDAVEARRRVEHLNAVLGAVREINQLITRESDRHRLLQQGCETLARTRGFHSAWTVLLAQDGRIEMAAEAATGEAFVGVRAQLARGGLPDCCRRALASGGPVVMPNPAVNCVACPLASHYHGTAAVAAPLRHEARIYGVLVAVLPAEMANDPEEVSLLREVAGDLAFALRTIELDEAQQKSEQAMHAMFDGAIDGMLLANAATRRFVDANPAVCRMLGYRLEEIKGLSVADIHPADGLEHVLSEFEKQAKGEITLARDLPVKRKDGSVFFADVGTSRFELEGHLHLLGIFRDITERKRMEQERAAMEAQLRQHQKLESIGTLASGVAHEINNPINGVMNYAQLILDKAEPGSPTAEFAKEIIHETERVATIVHSLLQFSRHEKQAHSPARITEIIEQTLSLIRTVLRHDQITLRADVAADLPTIKCRSQQIQQVLMNLLTNARDALNEKHPGHHDDKLIEVTCQPFTKEDRNWIRVTVEDHGPGLPAAVWERIFDPFFTTKPRDKGTGLGLSISRGIVKDHHGELWFETEPGCWTRFHMDLPVDNGWTL